MSMNVEIVIGGLAMFYQNDEGNAWNVIFICDESHPVKFKSKPTVNWKDLAVKGKNRTIKFDADQVIKPSSPKGADFEKILNMAGSKMHGAGKLKIKKKVSKNFITMTIPSSELAKNQPTSEPYYVINVKTGDFKNVGVVAKSGKVTFKVNNGNGVKMQITDKDGTTELANFPYKEGASHQLEFDNDCGLTTKAMNDFIEYYDWVEDKNGVTFWAGKITGKLAEMEKSFFGKTNKIDDFVGILSARNGNCDVVVVDPPPSNP